MTHSGIQKARAAAGGKDRDIARLLGISPAAVSRWKGVVPPDRAIEIEERTGGKVSRYEIRPDFFGAQPTATDLSRSKPSKPRRETTARRAA